MKQKNNPKKIAIITSFYVKSLVLIHARSLKSFILNAGLLVYIILAAINANAVTIDDTPKLINDSIIAPAVSNFCLSGNPGTIVGSDPCGGTGIYVYQWQSSIDEIEFNDIAGATSRDYTPPILTETIYYRRIVSSGSFTLTSNQIVINISQAIMDNMITAPLTDCSSHDPEIITGSFPSGGNGNYIYQWQSSTTGTSNTFINISGATAKDYNPQEITQTTYYRRQVSSGFCTFSSNTIKIIVQPTVNNNKLTAPGTTAFCGSGNPSIITGSMPQGGNGNFLYQWQCSTTDTNSGFRYISGATEKSYDPAMLTQTTYFRREVISGSCSYVTNVIKITVTPALANNIISASQKIINGSKAADLAGSLPSGGYATMYRYIWESSTENDSLGFVPASGNNTSRNYTPAILTKATFFRRKVTCANCSVITSNTINIIVADPNNSPQASDDAYSIMGNTTLNISDHGVLLNDIDPDKDTLITKAGILPSHGTLFMNTNGSFSYTPTTNFIGEDSFTYKVSDGLLSDTATVTIHITGNPVIGIAKSLTAPVMQKDGTYNLGFVITVRNMGVITLNKLQIKDDLIKAFPAPMIFKILSTPVSNVSGIVPNRMFNGNSDKNLLDSVSSLNAYSNCTISFIMNIDIHGNAGKFFSTVSAIAYGEGIRVDDDSTSGTDPDPDNNGRPDESDPTIVTLEGRPLIGIAKTVSTPVRLLDGKNSNILTYTIVVKNYGNVSLNGIQITDDLSKAFPFPITFSIEKAPSSSTAILIPNMAFNGNGNINLLQSKSALQQINTNSLNNNMPKISANGNDLPDMLAPGQSDTIRFTIRVTPDNNTTGTFNGSAKVTATDFAGNLISDISTKGLDPDPDHDGNPDENILTDIMLEKVSMRIPEGFSPNGDGVNDNLVIENFDNESISLEVHNSTGKLVYQNSDYRNDWAGICNRGSVGQETPKGNYFLVITKRNSMEQYIRNFTINR